MRNDVQEFLRNKIRNYLSQLTEEQVKFFNRIYKSVEDVPVDRLELAADQCERTIKNNSERAKKNQ